MSNAEIKQYKIFVDDFLVGTVYNFQNVKANLLFCLAKTQHLGHAMFQTK